MRKKWWICQTWWNWVGCHDGLWGLPGSLCPTSKIIDRGYRQFGKTRRHRSSWNLHEAGNGDRRMPYRLWWSQGSFGKEVRNGRRFGNTFILVHFFLINFHARFRLYIHIADYWKGTLECHWIPRPLFRIIYRITNLSNGLFLFHQGQKRWS